VDVMALADVLAGPNFDRARVHLLIVDPRGDLTDCIPYYRHHFEALRDFYKEAAAAGEAVVVWWD
jgi:3-deoxy-D-manno-octulosonate 8-phosphate phosphatase KdsC-like HAD superfamily phosphatase